MRDRVPHRAASLRPPSEVWWDVAAAEVTHDAETRQARATYEADRHKLQRFHY